MGTENKKPWQKKMRLSAGVLTLASIVGVGATAGDTPAAPALIDGIALPAHKPEITVIGDSITCNTTQKTHFLSDLLEKDPVYKNDVYINCKPGRTWETGEKILDQLSNKDLVSDKIIFALGTNQTHPGSKEAITPQDIDHILEKAPNSKIVFVTVYVSDKEMKEHRPWRDTDNAVFREAALDHPDNIRIADWYTLAKNDPRLMDPDGIHPSSNEGNMVWAETVSKPLKS